MPNVWIHPKYNATPTGGYDIAAVRIKLDNLEYNGKKLPNLWEKGSGGKD